MLKPKLKNRQFRPGDIVRFNPAHIARCPDLAGVRFEVSSVETIDRHGAQLVRGFVLGSESGIASLNCHLWMLRAAPIV